MTEKKVKIEVYLDKKTTNSLLKAAKQHDIGIKKLAATVLKIWATSYKDYPLE